MSDTPKYILEAVSRFRDNPPNGPKEQQDQNNRSFLLQLFLNGVPLHQYPESRELVQELIAGAFKRTQGRRATLQPHTRRAIAAHMAQLSASGKYAAKANGLKKKDDLCDVLAPIYGVSTGTIDGIRREYENTKLWEENVALAIRFPEASEI